MKKINDILIKCNIIEVIGNDDKEIVNLTFDSRKADNESAFFAVKGTQVDGHDYIDKAIESGCKVIVCEYIPKDVKDDVSYYVVDNTAKALGLAASEFYGRPSEKLRLVGVSSELSADLQVHGDLRKLQGKVDSVQTQEA